MVFDAKFGSSIAKEGFKNEEYVKTIFNNWEDSKLALVWLNKIGCDVKTIECIDAKVISRCKTDVTINVKGNSGVKTYGFQVKLISNPRGYNQIDKRWVDDYANIWQIPNDTVKLLKLFTGETTHVKACRDRRRMFLDEFDNDERIQVLSFFEANKSIILNTLFLGTKGQKPDWYLVIQKQVKQQSWSLTPIQEVIDYFGTGNIEITPRGSLKIGKIIMQRKGGDSGRPTANMLQFKINPAEIML